MSQPWSERFVLLSGLGTSAPYIVPPGKRAVCKSVTANNSSGVVGAAILRINGLNIWAAVLQAQTAYSGTMMMAVAYAGETIELQHTQTSMYSQVSGFLLDATAGSERQPAQDDEGPRQQPA